MIEKPPEQESHLPNYTSFVLRCWVSEDGQVHARLIDIHTRVEYFVSHLIHLPELIRRLLQSAAEAESQTGISTGTKRNRSQEIDM